MVHGELLCPPPFRSPTMFKPKQASRKYIDLIQQASSKFANWDPPHLIKVGCPTLNLCGNLSRPAHSQAGDYGKIDRETGKFEKEGNIYDNSCTDRVVADLAAQHPVIENPATDEYCLNSAHARRLEVDVGADAWVHSSTNT